MTSEPMPNEPAFSDAAIAAVFEEVLSRREGGSASEFESIGPYELIEKLGEGGFGIVWLAEQSEPVRREVAIKLIKPGIDSEEVLARFQREQQVLARLDHPGIARVFDVGLTSEDRPYIVMELVRGLPITGYCQQHGLSLEARIALFRQVCAALQHAHGKGVIHRDLKPTNILITEINGQPQPKIIDFGIAKALSHEGQPGMTWMTRQSRLIGTPSYMSPEQTTPGQSTDARTDVYALGVLLYELIADRPPFATDLPLSEMLRQIREDEPQRPIGDRSDLDWITLRCLEKDRERRYASAEALEEDLRCWQEGRPVSAHPPTRAYLLSRWLRRNRSLAASAALVALALLFGAGIALSQMLEARQQQRQAEAVESALITAMHRSITTRLGHAPRAYDLAKDVLLQIKAGGFPGSAETLQQILKHGGAAAAAAGDRGLANWAKEELKRLGEKNTP
jgi:eukaryotic-like serine/threonine-protein kinase